MSARSRDEVEEVGEVAAEEEPAGPASLRWVSWVLVALALLPPVVLAEVARRFLTGGADASYFGEFVSADEVRARLDFTFSVRFRLLWASVSIPNVLVGSLPVLLAVCAAVVARAPDWLVPSRWGRRIVAVAALLTAVESATCIVMLVELADAPRSDAYGNLQLTYLLPSTGGLLEIAPVLALLVVTTVLPLLAAALLRRGDHPDPAPVPDALPEPETRPEPEPRPLPEPDVAPGTSGVPKPSSQELDAYRRPS